MPLIPAKCPECGGLVEVDSEKRAGLCQHCGQPFVVEDAIQTFNTYYQTTNNYNTTHNYGDGTIVNIHDETSIEKRFDSGVNFLTKLHDVDSAIEKFDSITSDCAGDYRGWLGLAISYAVKYKQSNEEYKENFYTKMYKSLKNSYNVAPKDIADKLNSVIVKFNNTEFKSDSIIEKFKSEISNLEMEIEELEYQVLREKRSKENFVQYNSNKFLIRNSRLYKNDLIDMDNHISNYNNKISKKHQSIRALQVKIDKYKESNDSLTIFDEVIALGKLCDIEFLNKSKKTTESSSVDFSYGYFCNCPFCNTKVELSEEDYLWGSIECPKCGEYFVINN